jgi:hypothetical protein
MPEEPDNIHDIRRKVGFISTQCLEDRTGRKRTIRNSADARDSLGTYSTLGRHRMVGASALCLTSPLKASLIVSQTSSVVS